MVEVAEVSQLLFLPCDLDAQPEEVVIVLNILQFLVVDHLVLAEVTLDDLNDGLGIAKERSKDEYFAVGESSAFFSLEAALKVVDGVLDDYLPELFNLLLLVVLDENVIEVAPH